MRERFRRTFREDALSASLAVLLLVFGGLPLYGATAVDEQPFGWILLTFGALNTAAVLAVLLGSRRTRGAVAWSWGLLHVFLVFVMFTAGIFLAPAALLWMLIAVRSGSLSQVTVGAASLVVGSVGWGIALFAGVLLGSRADARGCANLAQG